MKNMQSKVVVITGASAGIGRATAWEFAEQGAHIALLARDEARLEEAKREVEQLGGKAIVIPTDVAEFDQVEAAAEQVERELGPIDVWVNNAMATVFAPVGEIAPADYKRVTDVTYHGYVWGTMVALKHMRARNRGTIVQVGSALAYRAIPLQSAYCGAKHAIEGFTESVRTELIHDESDIHITMVQMPAVNTPQFDWCATSMDKQPQPMGTVYQPEVAARAIVWASQAKRREVYVGLSASVAIWGEKLAPGVADHYLAGTAVSGQQTDQPISEDRPSNLWEPVPGPYSAHGRFDGKARNKSRALWLNMNRNWLLAGGAATLALAVAGNRWRK
jgi:NADP-dependent 3-hydroxy acid dehydrogenase YdfG